jgi:hypothetical protein
MFQIQMTETKAKQKPPRNTQNTRKCKQVEAVEAGLSLGGHGGPPLHLPVSCHIQLRKLRKLRAEKKLKEVLFCFSLSTLDFQLDQPRNTRK